MRGWLSSALPALVCLLGAAPGAAQPGRLSDAQAAALARSALAATTSAEQQSALHSLQAHRFKSSRAPEREIVLYVQGILEDRFERTSKAAQTLRKLERSWPDSPYLPEAQVILGEDALEQKRMKEAERRFRKVLSAELPAETKRRGQENMLWVLAEQGRAQEGLPIVQALIPNGLLKPSEKGLVGILEALCAARERAQAEDTLHSYQSLYPQGAYLQRVQLDWGRLLGSLGDARASAEVMQQVLQKSPNAPEADEARLALASLLSEGKLKAKEVPSLPPPEKLLAEMSAAGRRGDLARRALLLRLRMTLNQGRWQEVLDLAGQFRATYPKDGEEPTVSRFRADALKALTQQALSQGQIGLILGQLDREGILALTREQRFGVVRLLAKGGLAAAAHRVAALAPKPEQAGLRKALATEAQAPADAAALLDALPSRDGTPLEALRRAQAAMPLGNWPLVRASLPRARPCAERIAVLLALLRRPLETGEAKRDRLKEAEGWLARATEKGAERAPLATLVADLRAQSGDWRGALALYPAQPGPEARGWVALMRATAQKELGQTVAARATLKRAEDEPSFKAERQALAKRLGN